MRKIMTKFCFAWNLSEILSSATSCKIKFNLSLTLTPIDSDSWEMWNFSSEEVKQKCRFVSLIDESADEHWVCYSSFFYLLLVFVERKTRERGETRTTTAVRSSSVWFDISGRIGRSDLNEWMNQSLFKKIVKKQKRKQLICSLSHRNIKWIDWKNFLERYLP